VTCFCAVRRLSERLSQVVLAAGRRLAMHAVPAPRPAPQPRRSQPHRPGRLHLPGRYDRGQLALVVVKVYKNEEPVLSWRMSSQF